MFVQVSHYRLGTGSADDLRARVERGPAAHFRTADGFISYHAFDAGDGVVASVVIFQDEAQLRAAEDGLEEWIAETVEAFAIEPGHMSEGPVFASA